MQLVITQVALYVRSILFGKYKTFGRVYKTSTLLMMSNCDMEVQEYDLATLQRELQQTFNSINKSWDAIGLDTREREERLEHVDSKIRKVLQEVRNEEKSLLKQIHRRVEEYGHEVIKVSRELGIDVDDPGDLSLNLLKLEQYLRRTVETLHEEVAKRRTKLKSLALDEQELCETLQEDPTAPNKPIPSLEDIADLERTVRTLKQEKEHRLKTFKHLKGKILELREDLEFPTTLNNTLERSILCEVDELVSLSQKNIQSMIHLKESYANQVIANEKEAKVLREDISLFWNRLDIDEPDRFKFSASVQGYAPSALKKLRDEKERLEELMRQNMGRFINQLRRELENWWEKCYISDEERNGFTPYFSNSYTEEVMEAHDKEVKRLRHLYNQNEEIYILIDRRQELWQKMTVLEDKANDTNRLFGNRGCSLLQEEKERKRVRNELPRIEKTLKEAILGWELLNEKPFLVHGQILEDFITTTWEHYNEMKEKEKQERKAAKSRKLELESRLGTKNVSIISNNSKPPHGATWPRIAGFRVRKNSESNKSHPPAATPSPKHSRTTISSLRTPPPSRNSPRYRSASPGLSPIVKSPNTLPKAAFKAPRRLSAAKGIPKPSRNTSVLSSTRLSASKAESSNSQMLSSKNSSDRKSVV